MHRPHTYRGADPSTPRPSVMAYLILWAAVIGCAVYLALPSFR